MDVTKTDRDVKELLPIAQKVWEAFYDECIKQSVPVFLVERYRPQERQNFLYKRGRTRAGQIVKSKRMKAKKVDTLSIVVYNPSKQKKIFFSYDS